MMLNLSLSNANHFRANRTSSLVRPGTSPLEIAVEGREQVDQNDALTNDERVVRCRSQRDRGILREYFIS
uniref:Uncharacterized protein n=1 Tax=Pristionchus pacificus TaxID=54126 RepID=A0A2A6BIT9_PRIPA|eukprot:PDM65809.1 hypothetical protein PRIPAC_45210 [Pristionchus pacificus]